MPNKKNSPKPRFVAILWAVIVISPCSVPILAEDVPVGDVLNLSSAISGDWLRVYGTLNMYSGAYVDWHIFAYPGSEAGAAGATVNVYGCHPDNTLWVNAPTSQHPGHAPVVTVYGPKFKIGSVTYDAGDDIDIPINGLLEVLSEDETEVLFSLRIYSGDIDIRLRAPGSADTIEVDIDIKPGSAVNPINPGSNGLIPVAILTTDVLDAAIVDPATVTLAGADVAVRGKADKRMARMEDVDDDGDLDLMLQVEIQSDGADWTTGPVHLEGYTYDGEAIKGTDDVIVVPSEC